MLRISPGCRAFRLIVLFFLQNVLALGNCEIGGKQSRRPPLLALHRPSPTSKLTDQLQTTKCPARLKTATPTKRRTGFWALSVPKTDRSSRTRLAFAVCTRIRPRSCNQINLLLSKFQKQPTKKKASSSDGTKSRFARRSPS